MQRAAALQRIIKMRFNVWPEINQLTARGNSLHRISAIHSRGVEAAVAASTHAGHKKRQEVRSRNFRSALRSRILHQENRPTTNSIAQLNFESAQNKNLMSLFMIRLRRVYRA
jgi:hypothetical protein